MATDSICVVGVGTHPGPYWRNGDTLTREGDRLWVVCSRHRAQYEERADEFGPFDWQPFDPARVVQPPADLERPK